MADFNEVFERVEKKYRVTAEQRAALMPLLEQRMEPDKYGRSTVTSLYLDTEDHDLICRSLEKPLYKEKIRLRRYGTFETMSGQNDVFLELKKKYKGVVYKRRLRLTWDAAKDFLGGMPYEQACLSHPLNDAIQAQESLSPRSVQISREIKSFGAARGPLSPSMTIACDRTAFARRIAPADIPLSAAGACASLAPEGAGGLAGDKLSVGEESLRITFDDNIRYQDMRVRGRHSYAGETALLPQGESIMEIKMAASMPLWLSEALSACQIRPTSFSKYGEAFKALCA